MGKREDYIDKLAVQLKGWGIEIDVLKARAEKETEVVRSAIFKEVEIMNKQMQQAQKKIKEINEKNGDAWEILTEGANKAWNDLSEAVHRAGEKFK
jgi:regulator of protease activity HflC (stomatin/prohibitin superfamily)